MAVFHDSFWRGPKPMPETIFETSLIGDKRRWWVRGESSCILRAFRLTMIPTEGVQSHMKDEKLRRRVLERASCDPGGGEVHIEMYPLAGEFDLRKQDVEYLLQEMHSEALIDVRFDRAVAIVKLKVRGKMMFESLPKAAIGFHAEQ